MVAARTIRSCIVISPCCAESQTSRDFYSWLSGIYPLYQVVVPQSVFRGKDLSCAEVRSLGTMPLKSKRSPAEGEFLFELGEQPEECLAALGRLPLFVHTALPFSRCQI